MNEIRGMYLCNSLSQAKMRKQEKHRGKQRTQHSKNTVLVNCDAALNRPSEHSPAAAECASFEQLETQRRIRVWAALPPPRRSSARRP